MGLFYPFDLANFDLAAPLVRPGVEACRLLRVFPT